MRQLIACGVAGVCGAAVALAVRPAESHAPDRVVLGPADEVILAGTKPLTLANRDDRVSWGEQPTARAYAMGAVHIDRVLRALIQSDRFEGERAKLKEEADGQNAEFERRAKELEERYGKIEPGAPEFEQAQAEYSRLRAEFETWVAGIQRIQARLAAEQVEKAYREMLTAVEVVAERESVDTVMRYVPSSRPFEAGSLADAMLQVHARTFLRLPEGLDLTEAVMKEMALSDPGGTG